MRRATVLQAALLGASVLVLQACGGEDNTQSTGAASGTGAGTGGNATSTGTSMSNGSSSGPGGSGGSGGTMSGTGGGTSGTGGGTSGSGGAMSGSGGAMSGSGGTMSGTGGGTSGTGGGTSGSGGTMSGSGGAMSGSGGAMSGSGGSMSGTGGTTGGCTTNLECDDNVTCTIDACVMGACFNTPSDAACDNGAFCDGAELCDPANGAPGTGCTASSGSPCDDGLNCTIDACDDVQDQCTHTPNDNLCNDGKACTGVEACSPILGCISGTPLNCNDGISCTDDYCDLGTDSCAHTKDDNKCANGLFCDGVESCDPPNGNPMTGCAAGTPVNCADSIPCTVDSCNETTNQCDHTPNPMLCDNGVFCDGVETCNVGLGCQSGAPVICDDQRSCTSDTCSNVLKQCVFTPNHSACDDGLDCNGAETCDTNGPIPSGCLAGMPIPCPSDGVACTVDACNENNNMCEHTPDNTLCPPGEFCVPGQGNGCTQAMPCTMDSQCNDGDACNGVETCNVVCQPGVPVDCNDFFPCTTDTCNPMDGTCSHQAVDAVCNDGLGCNGEETCSLQLGCLIGMPVNCNDGVDCTFDLCQDPLGTCSNLPLDVLCDDFLLCNGAEICTTGGCVAGTPYVCPDDGVACTTEYCDTAIDLCKAVPDNTLCPCGQTCNPGLGGCGNWCVVSDCQGKVYECGECTDNDGDCMIDSADNQCLGPCDNTEDSYYGGIPGQNNSPCKADCYFDQDTGSGNDDCYWSHKCDPLEVAPDYPPEGDQCEYNPNATIPGYSGSCQDAFDMQSAQCLSYCGPLTPNGCDCFGCCVIEGLLPPTISVWLGSENPPGTGSCNENTLNDPAMCKPCTQVPACLNTCEHCEICIGKPDLPPDCLEQSCPPGVQPCGQPGQSPCPAGWTCITGCCQENPN